MKKRRMVDGVVKEEGGEEEAVEEDLEGAIEATAEEGETGEVIEVIEVEIVAEETGNMTTGEKTGEESTKTGGTGHVEGTEAVRMEVAAEAVTEAVVGLKEEEVAPGVEARMDTVIRQHIIQV